MADSTASAIRDSLSSPNVADSNGEPANIVDAVESLPYKRGYSEGRRGYGLVNPYEPGTPHASDFAAGHADGKRRRSKTGKSKASTFKDADKEIEDRWGCRTFKTARRCPKCGGKSLKRLPKSDECFGCVLKESVNA